MSILTKWIKACIGVFLALPVRADYLGSYLTLECNPEQNSAVVLPLGAWSPIPETPSHLDCTFKNGRHVRTKYGEGPPDRAGLPSATWVSIWIDKAQVEEDTHFGCWGEGRCSIYYEVSADGYKTCRLVPDSAIEQDFKALGKYYCEFKSNSELNKTVDLREFPG